MMNRSENYHTIKLYHQALSRYGTAKKTAESSHGVHYSSELRHGFSGEWDATRLRGYGMIVRNHGADAKYEDQFECWGVWRDLDLR